MIFSIGDAGPNHDLNDWFCGVLCSGVGCYYLASLMILLSVSYFVLVITGITEMFMAMAITFELQLLDIETRYFRFCHRSPSKTFLPPTPQPTPSPPRNFF